MTDERCHDVFQGERWGTYTGSGASATTSSVTGTSQVRDSRECKSEMMLVSGLLCGGHGTCVCRACLCDPGWSGAACDCREAPEQFGAQRSLCSASAVYGALTLVTGAPLLPLRLIAPRMAALLAERSIWGSGGERGPGGGTSSALDAETGPLPLVPGPA